MPKFYVSYRVDHYGETVIDADNIEQARQIAEEDSTKAYADWDILEDVSDADITELEQVVDDFEL